MTIKDSGPLGSRRRVRMRDVAERCSVSISTVSLVLSGDTRIPEDTARKVLQTVKAMEYRPSVIARSLARRGSRTVGVILPEFAFLKNQPFYYQALQGIHQATQPAGYKIVVEAANRKFLERRYYLRLLKEQSADAIIYMAAGVEDLFLSDMTKEAYPFVLLACQANGVELPSAIGNDFEGAKMATAYLLKLGHRAIGHVAGLGTMFAGRERERGYRAAMKEAGTPVDPAWVVKGDLDSVVAEQAVNGLIKAGVSAIFAATDMMAYGVLRGLRLAQKKVPEDISVIGMDDLDATAWMNPPLTSVRYDITHMAGLAAKFAIKQIDAPIFQSGVIGDMPPPQLMVRGSCAEKK